MPFRVTGGPGRRYPAAVASPTRDEAWHLFCQWTGSDSLRKQVLGVIGAMEEHSEALGLAAPPS